ncbi:hypothetical protein Q8F55_007698 [Vanrija albida]|uniref:Mid2 domain-containing protein n=1 Tax=Vanrija albida TaxID=181172 RepID=A0ABR3PU93_9TREE
MRRSLALTAAAVLATTAHAFSFSTSQAAQCEPWTITWDGGQGPFNLVLVPTLEGPNGHLANVSIPAQSGSPPYTHTFALDQPEGLQMVATMYDATGWGSGGVSPIITVGRSPSGNSSCLKPAPPLDFGFWLDPNTNPPQCGSVAVAWNATSAVYPVKLYGIVPAGTAWSIPVSQDKNTPTINWAANIAAGTQFVLLMSDASRVGTGGSTPLLTVQSSSDTTCLDSGSPSVTPVVTPSSTGSASSHQSSAPTNTAGASNGGGKKGTNVWAIVGPILAVVLALLILAVVLLWCRSRRRERAAVKPGMTPLAMEEREGRPGILDVGDVGSDTPTSPFTPGFSPANTPGHSRFNSRTTNNRNSWGDSLPAASVRGAYEGQPHGAQAPSLLTDGPEEHFELHPFPFEESQGGTSNSSHQPRNSAYTAVTESSKLESEYARGRAAGHTRASESTSGPRPGNGPSPQGEWETSFDPPPQYTFRLANPDPDQQ